MLKRRETVSLAMGKGREGSLVRLSDVVCQGKTYCVEEMQDQDTVSADLSMHSQKILCGFESHRNRTT